MCIVGRKDVYWWMCMCRMDVYVQMDVYCWKEGKQLVTYYMGCFETSVAVCSCVRVSVPSYCSTCLASLALTGVYGVFCLCPDIIVETLKGIKGKESPKKLLFLIVPPLLFFPFALEGTWRNLAGMSRFFRWTVSSCLQTSFGWIVETQNLPRTQRKQVKDSQTPLSLAENTIRLAIDAADDETRRTLRRRRRDTPDGTLQFLVVVVFCVQV